MLWVLKRIVSMRWFFWVPKTYVQTQSDGLENIYNFKNFVYLNLCLRDHRFGYQNNSNSVWEDFYNYLANIWAMTHDFLQCGIFRCVDSNEPVQSPFKLRNPNWCSVSSLTLIEYSSNSKGSDHTAHSAGWSEALLVAHNTLLEIPCYGSKSWLFIGLMLRRQRSGIYTIKYHNRIMLLSNVNEFYRISKLAIVICFSALQPFHILKFMLSRLNCRWLFKDSNPVWDGYLWPLTAVCDGPLCQGPSWPRILGRSDFSLQEN